MRDQVYKLFEKSYRMHQRKGSEAFLRGVFRFARQRLPAGFWPPLLLDPVRAADEEVPVHETSSLELRYNGQFDDELPRQLAMAEGRVLEAEGTVFAYRDADIVGHRPVVRVEDTYFPPSWLGVETAYFIHQEKYLRRNLPLTHGVRTRMDPDPDRVVDTGFLLLGERGLEFPAWHHEVLPKLHWLEEYEAETGESPTLLLPADVHSFRKRSLELMGYDPDNWILGTNETTRVRKLLLAPHPRRAKGTHLHTTHNELNWAADRIQSNVDLSGSDFSNRIFISREDADRRHIRNREDVLDMLRDEGFEAYEPGRLSYEEEVQLFAGADIVVGAHGKGLASLFHAEDATLIELFPEGGATEHYFLTAVECELNYEFMECTPVDDDRNLRARDQDMTVDVPALRRLIAGQ